MIGTMIFIGVIVCGYLKTSFLVLIPASIAAAFVGAHGFPGKAERLKARGQYWTVIFLSAPLIGIILTILFFIGRAMS